MPTLPQLPNFSDIPTAQKRIVIVVAGVLLVGIVFFLVRANIRQTPEGQGEGTLTIWGVLSADEFAALIQNYQTAQPKVQIEYREIKLDQYERTLVNALAAGVGPDIFMVRNRSLPKSLDKIVPADFQTFNFAQLRELFPTVVEQDFALNGQVYALPLYLDTMVFIYNKNIFDQAALVRPPKTWQEFQNIIPRLRLLSPTGQIVKAASAIGGSLKTNELAVDLVSLLMMQNGALLANAGAPQLNFNSPEGADAGLKAFNFYLQFATPGSPSYTWNDNQRDFLESFISGQTASIFAYHRHLKEINRRAPFLNYAISPMLQIPDVDFEANYADYWGFAVSRQGKSPAAAWSFIVYVTTDLSSVRNYLGLSGRPPALRPLIEEYLGNPNYAVWSREALTARSWYQPDDVEVGQIFSRAISRVLTGQADSGKALLEVQEQVGALLLPAGSE